MRRWNGWGDESVDYPLPDIALEHLAEIIGEGLIIQDASLDDVLSRVPEPDIPHSPFIKIDPVDRVRHARGQSLPDWIALRSGKIHRFPDGVAYPRTDKDVREIIDFASQTHTRLIPYGGGTSVVGHINPISDDFPILTVDLSHLNQLINLDSNDLLATFGAGISGPHLEVQLAENGYTLGHFPQSFEYSTLGGWIATRSSGQQSFYYGRIEDLFAGGHLETPVGPLDIPSFPASAAGPDLRHILLGSEGRLGIITRASVRIHPLPEYECFFGAIFHDWDTGANALRTIVQSGIPFSMMRLSDAQETETTLLLSGKQNLIKWADRALRLLKFNGKRCMLIYGVTGDKSKAKTAYHDTNALIRSNGGLPTGQTIGNIWEKSRFTAPYLRNTLWEVGYAVDTLESVFNWSRLGEALSSIKSSIQTALHDDNEQILVFSHLSHFYPDGASIYITYIFRRSPDPDEMLYRWKNIKNKASISIIKFGGTISHHHGVGTDHAEYLRSEKGSVGMAALSGIINSFDPERLLNPGKLLVH